MKNFCLIIPTARRSRHAELLENLRSSLNQSGYTYDIIFSTPDKELKLDIPVYYDNQDGGVWSANETWKLLNQEYDFAMIGSDRMTVSGNWYDIMGYIDQNMKNNKFKVMSWPSMSCKLNGIPFGWMYVLAQETIKTVFKGNLINPIYHHQCADPDIGMQMYTCGETVDFFIGGHIHFCQYRGAEEAYTLTSKDKYFKLDIMLYDHIWKDKLGGTPEYIIRDFYKCSFFTDEELLKMKEELLKKNLWQ